MKSLDLIVGMTMIYCDGNATKPGFGKSYFMYLENKVVFPYLNPGKKAKARE